MTCPSQIQVTLACGEESLLHTQHSLPILRPVLDTEARELMVTRAVARRGSAEKSECPWSQRLKGDQITVIY